MKKIWLLALLALATAGLWAIDMQVVYFEGRVSVQSGSRWNQLDMGMTVRSEDTVRVDAGGYLELNGQPGTIRISNPGTYRISTLLDQAAQAAPARVGFAGAVSNSVANFLNGPTATRSAVMGVRGSNAETGGVGYTDSLDPQILLSQGIARLARGDAAGAVTLLQDAYDYAGETLYTEAAFYLGLAFASANRLDDAADVLGGEPARNSDYFYTDYAIVYAQVMIAQGDGDGAAALLQTYRGSQVAAQTPPAVLLVQAQAYDAAGRSDDARGVYRELLEAHPNSPEAAQARTSAD